jgi:hypothetical protein
VGVCWPAGTGLAVFVAIDQLVVTHGAADAGVGSVVELVTRGAGGGVDAAVLAAGEPSVAVGPSVGLNHQEGQAIGC